MSTADLVSRLLEVEVSALCDADKSLPVLAPEIRALVPDVRMAGPAFTVVAEHVGRLDAGGESGLEFRVDA